MMTETRLHEQGNRSLTENRECRLQTFATVMQPIFHEGIDERYEPNDGDRLREIARILAVGILRLRTRARLSAEQLPDVKKISEIRPEQP